jgi:hypothetical protein
MMTKSSIFVVSISLKLKSFKKSQLQSRIDGKGINFYYFCKKFNKVPRRSLFDSKKKV